MALEREVTELRAVNVRLSDSDAAANREVAHLRERNEVLLNENDHMRK